MAVSRRLPLGLRQLVLDHIGKVLDVAMWIGRATLAAKPAAVGTLSLRLEGWAPHERASVIWLDDAVLTVTNTTGSAT